MHIVRGVLQGFDPTVPPVPVMIDVSRSGREYPTVAESGLPGYEAESWYAMFATGGTPRDIVNRLNAAISRIVATPEVRADVAMRAKVVMQTGAKAD